MNETHDKMSYPEKLSYSELLAIKVLPEQRWVRGIFFTSRFVISPSRLTCVKCKRKHKSSGATGRKQQRKNQNHFFTFVVLRLSFGHACEPVTYKQLRNLIDYLQ